MFENKEILSDSIFNEAYANYEIPFTLEAEDEKIALKKKIFLIIVDTLTLNNFNKK
jgi:hypothetical protein